ncbi:MAG: M23 family metallopeptidase [Dokdonella sp.]
MAAHAALCGSGFSRDAFVAVLEKASRLKPLLQEKYFPPRCLGIVLALLCAAPFATASEFPRQVSQGALVIGKVTPDSVVRHANRDLLVTAKGEVVFGVGRDETGPVTVDVREHNGQLEHIVIEVNPRDWPIERVDGVPPKTVEPPPDIAARIKREQARVVAARLRDDARDDFLEAFAWPVTGRISGRFGSQRVYNGIPKSPHPGMDIAVPQGTPVKAPASGIVTFADADLYLTGGTVLLDHGHGVSSNFLHMSRIDVKVGDHIDQGQVIGAVGMTGRATGPHLHWGMNWFDVRLDPLLLVAPQP